MSLVEWFHTLYLLAVITAIVSACWAITQYQSIMWVEAVMAEIRANAIAVIPAHELERQPETTEKSREDSVPDERRALEPLRMGR
jgi:hypothetical protein